MKKINKNKQSKKRKKKRKLPIYFEQINKSLLFED